MSPEVPLKEIVLRDLQPLLCESISEDVIVDSFTTHNLLPPGENYGSTILSVHVIIRKGKNAEKEDLHLIAKMPPPTDFQRRIFDSPYTFRKEIFMYKDILPSYNRLEIKCGVKEGEVFDVLPKFYGSRLSLDPAVDFDDNAVILLENLKARGYYTGNRCTGYDYEHSKYAIRAMARFHALGMATKYKTPDYFEILKKRSKSLDMALDEFENVHKILLKKIEDDTEMRPHYEKCNRILSDTKAAMEVWTAVPTEPWSTIIHSDFWVNNIMFHRGEDNRVDDVKFVDFQNYLFLSPLREMVFYLFSSVDDDVHAHHIDELMDLYHETFISILCNMGCDVSPFSRKKFDAQIAIDANIEFMHLCFMLKVLTLDVQETNFDYDKIHQVMVNYGGNQAFVDRLRKLVLYFAAHNWI